MVEPRSRTPIYLVQFTYSSDAWQRMLTNQTERNRDVPVKELLKRFHGALGQVTFPDSPYDGPRFFEKSLIEGRRQVVAILLFENKIYAEAFGVYLEAEVGVQDVVMTPLTLMADMVNAVEVAGAVKADTTLKYRRP